METNYFANTNKENKELMVKVDFTFNSWCPKVVITEVNTGQVLLKGEIIEIFSIFLKKSDRALYFTEVLNLDKTSYSMYDFIRKLEDKIGESTTYTVPYRRLENLIASQLLREEYKYYTQGFKVQLHPISGEIDIRKNIINLINNTNPYIKFIAVTTSPLRDDVFISFSDLFNNNPLASGKGLNLLKDTLNSDAISHPLKDEILKRLKTTGPSTIKDFILSLPLIDKKEVYKKGTIHPNNVIPYLVYVLQDLYKTKEIEDRNIKINAFGEVTTFVVID